MQRLNVRNIDDDIYKQFEQEAARQERSTEAHARFVIAQSVRREAALTGADRYRWELSARLNHLLPLVNEAAPNPGPGYQPPMDAAALAERLGEANPLAVMNWFSGHDVPDFEQADQLATYLGCAPRWLKFGEGRPFTFGSPRRLNGHGGAYEDARALLAPDAAGNPVYKISIIRDDSEQGHILILREFRNSLQAEIFWTNLNLSEHVGNGGFHDLCDFFAMLEQLWIFYTNNDVFVKSYDVARGRLQYEFEENDCHPLLITKRCGRENIWWEDIWQEEMLEHRHPERNGGYFWPGDSKIIERVIAHLKEKQRLMNQEDLEMLTRYSFGMDDVRARYKLSDLPATPAGNNADDASSEE
ncbi:FitA-like ribbon-helix-helix domain-containing protein [Serratia ficaria]|uniref:FitA-like ribbon-helix-helix domain-containing protein n=1 Tax=Serratia ficaria TaxID=61651 RepID=UPI00077C3698|nr:hypothetical protein [Serratia ficaria]